MADYAISNVARRVVYTNTGVGPYAFTFEILANTDIAVYRGSTLLTLTTDYSVTINANGTGSVTLVTAGTGNITIVGSRAIQRTSDYTTGGDLFASTLNTDLDSQTIYVQQVAETAERGLKAPVVDPTDINMTLPAKATRAGTVLAFNATTGNPEAGPSIGAVTTVAAQSANINTVATNIASVNTVAGNTSNINTVAGVSSNVTTVAGSISNVNTVASDLNEPVSEINTVATDIANVNAVGTNIANVNTVASNSTNINTVAGISGNVTTVAGISGNVSTVAGISANVSTVAGISANVTTVAGISSNVSTVATNNANVTTVATNIASVNTNATNIVAIQNASTNATNAANSATAAANSATAAQAAQTAAEAALDAFDDIYLGAKSSNPTVDNDGNVLTTGDQYFNTVANELRIWNGSSWQAASVIGGTVTTLSVTGNTTLGDASGDTLTVNSNAVSIPNGLNFDSNTLVIDAANNRVGVNNATPTTALDVTGTATISTNLAFTGTGNRITGDFSNATVANRVAFQTSTTNGNLNAGFLPNGTATQAIVRVYNNSDPTNAAGLDINANSTTASLNSIITGTGTYLPLTMFTGGSERLRIDTSGNVGIGTASPASLLHISGGALRGSNAADTLQLIGGVSGTANNIQVRGASHPSTPNIVTFDTNSTERMRIDSSGNVGIGTSSPGTILDVYKSSGNPYFRIYTGTGSVQGYMQALDSTYVKMGSLSNHDLGLTTNGTERMRIDSSGRLLVGTTAVTTSSGQSGEIYSTGATGFMMTNSTAANYALAIKNEGTSGTRNLINFYEGSAGGTARANVSFDSSANTFIKTSGATDLLLGTNNTERMRIDSSGRVLVGLTSWAGGSTNAGIAIKATSTSSSVFAFYIDDSGGNNIVNMRCDGSTYNKTGVWGTISDQRLKENIVDATPKLNDLLQLQVRNFNFTNDENKTKQIGFIAQEIEQVFPSLISEDSEGTKAIKTTVLLPMLVKAIQEQQAMIEELKQEVALLKSK